MGRRTENIFCLAVYCLIAAFVIPCAAQEKGRCVVEGTVLCAETDTPIAGAFVSFIKDNKIVASCLCDGDGAFSMSFINGAPDAVSASMLGYAPAKTQARHDGRMTIRLKEKKLSIKASTVTSSVIEHKGDTTSYSAGAFRDQKDMTVADILKKIPTDGNTVRNHTPQRRINYKILCRGPGPYGRKIRQHYKQSFGR